MMMPLFIIAFLVWVIARGSNPVSPIFAALLIVPYAFWCFRVWANYKDAVLKGWHITVGDILSRGNRLRLFPKIPPRPDAEEMEGFVRSRDDLANLVGVTMREPYDTYIKRVFRKAN